MTTNDFSMINDPALQKRLKEKGFTKPTPIQQKLMPLVSKKVDVLAQAETGSGKTLAFLLPVLERIAFEENDPRVLILTPTRELALQIEEVIKDIAVYKRLKPVTIIGDMSYEAQEVQLRQKSHIVIGTPGRVLDLISKETIKSEKIDTLILDEVDHLFDRGFTETIESIIDTLNETRQNIYTSATISEEIEPFIKATLKQPKRLMITPTNQDVFDQVRVEVDTYDKVETVVDILVEENVTEAIIFCEEKRTVDEVADELADLGIPVVRLHGDLKQPVRIKALKQFKEKVRPILVTTNLMARGIDLVGLPLVINYDLAYTEDVFTHRMGRTGRMHNKGTVVHLLTPQDISSYETFKNQLNFNDRTVSYPHRELDDKKDYVNMLRRQKKQETNDSVTTLFFNGGKEKKLRAYDFVGAINALSGVDFEDIGVITVYPRHTTVEILNNKGETVLKKMKHTRVKKKQLKVHIDRDTHL
ncbi:ATP-dependent RNA helicase DbpA [Halolactibacillus alkaliphilus]|uniref:ATP-dependent RNA helicase DbpA n=1 Tax=Halolactibacillus alkaliphilus TaxID=442899 RepID=A0A511X2E2_9BACI|nr:DEAD/DEAH box helicase [Halolactibacillus alkaliphilus]GEN57120.1 ATP-dependent RNA helicase DbpA [Halolactibacillus alkaliphilus]GGN72063.1 ATP-dependent RNA helicase DbpA [Halolactibacillus alkaliphilus]SFO87800.1 Superfamily II DNA and RNA helicase [Halolactibacillus alkaliphilus]